MLVERDFQQRRYGLAITGITRQSQDCPALTYPSHLAPPLRRISLILARPAGATRRSRDDSIEKRPRPISSTILFLYLPFLYLPFLYLPFL